MLATAQVILGHVACQLKYLPMLLYIRTSSSCSAAPCRSPLQMRTNSWLRGLTALGMPAQVGSLGTAPRSLLRTGAWLGTSPLRLQGPGWRIAQPPARPPHSQQAGSNRP